MEMNETQKWTHQNCNVTSGDSPLLIIWANLTFAAIARLVSAYRRWEQFHVSTLSVSFTTPPAVSSMWQTRAAPIPSHTHGPPLGHGLKKKKTVFCWCPNHINLDKANSALHLREPDDWGEGCWPLWESDSLRTVERTNLKGQRRNSLLACN